MNNLFFGLEISVIGFIITMVTLFLLAGILLIFTLVFSKGKDGGRQGQKNTIQVIEPQKKPAAKTGIEISPDSGATVLRPEMVAAAIGAINYTLEKRAPRFPVIANILSNEAPINFWALASRTRLVNLRQDFVSHKRGKLK